MHFWIIIRNMKNNDLYLNHIKTSVYFTDFRRTTMQNRLSFSSFLVIGSMLFALFFGAGNLIFPAQLGQNAGTNLWIATFGFLVTGIGLPFLGILAMGFSGSRNLQELSSRIHPIYGIVFTSLLYLTIGPFFAGPRTGAVAYEIAVSPFVPAGQVQLFLLLFTLLFFGISLYFSLNPAKIVDRIGKIMAPTIVILLVILIGFTFAKPIGVIQNPVGVYNESPFFKGFVEGYGTMDTLASLVFGIIVINVLRSKGITDRKKIISATAKTGFIAAFLLAIIYAGIAYLGATTTEKFGIFDTGGPVLSETSAYYFGTTGTILLTIVIILACLTTSIGLITACAEYFQTIIPKISYKMFVVLFSSLCFIVANFGLANIITFSIPVLMFLYPLAIVLMLLTFASPLFNHSRIVYISATVAAFLVSIIDGITTLYNTLEIDVAEWPAWLNAIVSFYDQVLPLYGDGLGWLVPVLVVMIVTGVIVRLIGR